MQSVKTAQANYVYADLIGKADTEPITSETVTFYLQALSGENALKWWNAASSSWSATEVSAGTGSHQGRGLWTCLIAAGAWLEDTRYTLTARVADNDQIDYRDFLLTPTAAVQVQTGLVYPTVGELWRSSGGHGINVNETIICNAALRLIGAAPIHALTDQTNEARACQFFWPLIRATVFRSYPWTCISIQASLTYSAGEPPFGWNYAYVLPIDYVRMNGMEDANESYEVRKGLLCCNVSPANIDYVTMETDCTKYSPDLVRCLYLNLAYELGYDLTHQVDISNAIKADLEKFFLPRAEMNNATETGVRVITGSTFTDVFR